MSPTAKKSTKQPRARKARALTPATPDGMPATPPVKAPGFHFRVSEAEHAAIAAAQRAYSNDMAAKIDAGTDLTAMDRLWISAILRDHAQRIPSKPKKPKGRPQVHSAGDIAMLYAAYRMNPAWTEEEAIARVALAHNAPEDTVRSIVRNHREAIANMRRLR